MKLLGCDNVIYFLDTSAILNGALKEYSNVCISTTVLSELENIKTSLHKNDQIKFKLKELFSLGDQFNVGVSVSALQNPPY